MYGATPGQATAGEPRALALSHRNLVAGAASSARCFGIKPGDRALAALPFHGDYGLNLLLAALVVGATVVLDDARLRVLACDSLSNLARRRILRRAFIDLLLARRLPEDPATHGDTLWRLLMREQWLARAGRGGFSLETSPGALVLVAG